MTKITDYKILTFDCYGTLIDWESGIWDALQPLWTANGCTLDRHTALVAFADAESARQGATPEMPYPEVLAHAHGALAERFRLRTTQDMDRAFGNSVPHWPAFPDTADALRRLKTRFKLAILSNVDRDGFAASNRKLGVAFDAIYTAQDVGSYKPASANFEYMLERLEADLGLGPGDVLHTAQSLFHDHVPARNLGLANAWIDRQKLAEGGGWGATAQVARHPEVDFRFTTMMEMAEAADADG